MANMIATHHELSKCFPELKDKVLGFWIDYNYQRDDDDYWFDEDGEEGRRYQCGDCNTPFTIVMSVLRKRTKKNR